MQQSWKARKMVPGKDTLSTMALHYGISDVAIRDIILQLGVEVFREDGFRGTLEMVVTQEASSGQTRNRNRKVIGWSDGQPGVNISTTKLTKQAIMTVARWKIEHQDAAA